MNFENKICKLERCKYNTDIETKNKQYTEVTRLQKDTF